MAPRSATAVLALALSALALGVAVLAPTRERPQPARAQPRVDRVAALERQVAELASEVEALKAERHEPLRRTHSGSPWSAPEEGATEAAERAAGDAEAEGSIEAIVDAAVDRKAEQVMGELRLKTDRKPAIGVLASVLELTEEQRRATERIVVDGQSQVHAILRTPVADGTNLMDELVEIAARGIAEPGRDHGFGRWLARVLSENIPGTSETYGTRIETVKSTMRAAFKREWTEAQYREFEEWGVDPTEIEKVPGSPNDALWKRINERATELGAVPGEEQPGGD